MFSQRNLAATVFVLLFFVASLEAANLSTYREFQLDSGLAELAEQANMHPSDATVIHERPAMIQELSWRAPSGDSLKGIKFGFYEGELFRMIASYDGYNIEGLTVPDMVKAISETYGEAIDSTAEITLPSIYDDDEKVQVLARWRDSDWSFNLVRSKHDPSYYLVALSERLYSVAEAADEEALRLDRLEAPRREVERLEARQEQRRVRQEQARTDNVPSFRP